MNTCRECCYWTPNLNPRKEGDLQSRLCLHPEINYETQDDYTCNHFMPATATIVNVPAHTKNGTMSLRNQNPVPGPVEILIVTHAKDFGWLAWGLRCARKYLSGFQGITVAYPRVQHSTFAFIKEAFGVHLHPYDEIEGKGMLHHMVKMAEAEQVVPPETKYVMHFDADCIYHMPTTPEDYFYNDKPVYLVRTWDSLTTEDPNKPGTKVVSDCLQWKEPTTKQLGFETEFYSMCRHPTVLPVSFYKPYREFIAKLHRAPYADYMLSGRNDFPQDRMDWTAMGGYARRFMADQFHWTQIGVDETPKDRCKQFWSHGGILADIQRTIEGYLR